MNKDNIKISEKEINGAVRKINVYCPSHEEWVEAIGAERLASRFNQGLIAHDLATSLKAAYVESKKESVNERRAVTRGLVENPDHVFDLRDFIAAERKAQESKLAKAQAEAEKAKAAQAESLKLMAQAMGTTVEALEMLLAKTKAENEAQVAGAEPAEGDGEEDESEES